MVRKSDAAEVYRTVELFKDRCLREGRSLLWPDLQVWSPETIAPIPRVLIENPDYGNATFLDKLKAQLADQPDDVIRVAVDAVVFYLLFPEPGTIKQAKKLETVNAVLAWRPEELALSDESRALLSATFAEGIGEAGTYYLTARPDHIAFYLSFFQGVLEGQADLADQDSCQRLITDLNAALNGTTQARHILMHLLFPDRFEAIAADSVKRKIVKAFSEESGGATDLDEALWNIRQAEAARLDMGVEEFDFYQPGIRERWADKAGVAGVEPVKDPAKYDPDAARMLFETLLPNPEQRALALRRLADTITRAHAINPGSWVVNLRGKSEVRLTVGQLEAICIRAQHLDLVADPSIGTALDWADLLELPGIGLKWAKPFTVVPNINTFTISDSSIRETLDLISPYHDAAVDAAASKVVTRTSYYKSHSPGVLDFLRQEFDPGLPNPDYGLPTPAPATAKRYWKISAGSGGAWWTMFRDHDMIGVNWPGSPDLRTVDASSPAALKPALETIPAMREERFQFQHAANQLHAFLTMRKGDLVCAYGGGKVLGWGAITGPYTYLADAVAPHQHAVAWQATEPVDTPSLSPGLADRLKQNTTIIELTQAEFAEIAGEPNPGWIEPPLEDIAAKILSQGMRISDRDLRRYHLSLKSRGFVVLSGLSGTGKTWLADAYAQAAGARHQLVAVAPNWMTNEDLLGYLNPLTGVYHDTAVSRFLREAGEAWKAATEQRVTPQPFHLVLDEMNLARVEHYFAQFLSAMEVRARHGTATISLGTGDSLPLTPNLFVIGTVNIDETTHGFADKIYDRAQLIDLGVDRDELRDYVGDVHHRDDLMAVWDAVRETGPFTYRVIKDIGEYVKAGQELGASWEELLDEQLVQKVLPKLKGSGSAVGVALERVADLSRERFPLTRARASAMLEGYRQHGFAAYFR